MKTSETLIETLENRLQEEYQAGGTINQEVVTDFAVEEFEEAGGAEAFGIDEDEVQDFLVDEVIGNITICL